MFHKMTRDNIDFIYSDEVQAWKKQKNETHKTSQPPTGMGILKKLYKIQIKQ